MDEDDFSEDIDKIYQVATSPLLWNELTSIISKRIGCTAVQLLNGNQETGEVYNAYSSILTARDVHFYQTNIFQYDHFVAVTKACKVGRVHDDKMVLSDNEMRASQSYQEFYQQYGMQHWMFTDIQHNENKRMLLAFSREKKDHAFTKDEISYIQRLVPHLKNAQSINERFRIAQLNYQNTFEYFNRIDSPVIAVSKKLNILHINELAEQLNKNKLITIRNNHLILNNQLSQDKLLSFLDSVNKESFQSAKPWFNYLNYKIQILYLHCDMSENMLISNNIYILIFENIETNEQKIDRLSSLYSLTQTERYVVKLLMENYKVTSIAKVLMVSTETIRFHLKNIFSKTGTHSQKELILLFLND